MKPHTSISVPARPFLQGRPGTWPALVAVLTLLAGAPPDRGLHAQMVPDAPIEDFRLPMFDDDQGYRAWDLRGDQALYLSADRIDVIGMRLRVFAGGPEERIRMTIVSPEAHVLADRNEARGEDDGVRQNPAIEQKDQRIERRGQSKQQQQHAGVTVRLDEHPEQDPADG